MELLVLDKDKHSYAVVKDRQCLGEVTRNGRGYNWVSYKNLYTGHSPSLPKALHKLSLIASLYGSFRAVTIREGAAILCFGQAPVIELGKAVRYFESLLSPMPFYYIAWSKGGKKVQMWDKRKGEWIDVGR